MLARTNRRNEGWDLDRETSPTITKRLTGAAVGFIGGGVLSMILLALIVSVFEMGFHSIMPGALAVGGICAIVGFCSPKLGSILSEFVG
jgi:hypothetical protein